MDGAGVSAININEVPTRWRVVLTAVAAGICTGLHVGKVPPAIPLLRDALGMDLTTAGWVLSMFAAVGALAATVAGVLSDAFSARWGAVVGLLLLTLGSLVSAAVGTENGLLLGRLIESGGVLLLIVCCPAVIWSAVSIADSRVAFSLWGTWLPLGSGIMMMASPLILPILGWQGAWIVAAAATMVLALILWSATRDLVVARRPPVRVADLQHVLTSPAMWMLATAFGVYTFCYNALVGFFPVLAVERLGMTPTVATVLAGLVALSNASGNLIAGALARFGWPRGLTIGVALSSVALSAPLIFLDFLPDWARCVMAFIYAGGGGLLPATVFGMAPLFAPHPDKVGGVSGFIVQGSNIGLLVGPPALGAVVTHFGGWSAAPLLLVPAALLGVAAAAGVARLERR